MKSRLRYTCIVSCHPNRMIKLAQALSSSFCFHLIYFPPTNRLKEFSDLMM